MKYLLKYSRATGVDPLTVPGSIYGAIGLCQFMPSNVSLYGIDGDGSGSIDLFTTPDALDSIGELRAQFGANINRLEHTVNNLSNMKENTDMANGRIMDADFAQESTNMTKNQMLMQAGMSVLSNSNQMTGMVTSLLR